MTQQTRDLLRKLAQAAVEAEARWRTVSFAENPPEHVKLKRETRAACEALEQEIEPADILELLAAADREVQLRTAAQKFIETLDETLEDWWRDTGDEENETVTTLKAIWVDSLGLRRALSSSPLPATPTPIRIDPENSETWPPHDPDTSHDSVLVLIGNSDGP